MVSGKLIVVGTETIRQTGYECGHISAHTIDVLANAGVTWWLTPKKTFAKCASRKCIAIDSQNTRGSSGDGYKDRYGKLIEIMRKMNINNTFASLLQETWLPSTQLDIPQEGGKYHFISAGHDNATSHGRRKGGVGIILSPPALKAWQDHKGWMKYFGPNIIALKIMIRTGSKNHRGRHTKRIYLVSGYSPCNPDSRTKHTQYNNPRKYYKVSM